MTLDIHMIPALLDAMALAGCTLAEAAAALRAIITLRQEKTHGLENREKQDQQQARETSDGDSETSPAGATVAPVAATSRDSRATGDSRERKRERDRLRMREKRAASSMSPVSPDAGDCRGDTGDSASLSLKVINLNPEREIPVAATVAATSATVAPLPPEWKPDAKSQAAAVESLGSDAAQAALLVNFRDYYGARPHVARTPREWNQTYRAWGRKERKIRAGPPQLPLVRVFDGPARPAIPGKVYAAFGSPQWEAWSKHHGPAGFPRDRAGGWWFESEWPPGYREAG